MAFKRNQDSQRFRWWNSDRSGFQFGFQPLTSAPNEYKREAGKPTDDKGFKVAPEEYDSPPPSKKSLGGEGDISGDPRANSDFSVDANVYRIPSESTIPVVYVNSSRSIAWNLEPEVYVTGSNAAQVMSVNPQIVAGAQGQQLALQCIGSSITLINGSGITFAFQSPRIRMDSGGIAVLLYSVTDNTWHLTSFNASGGF